MGKTYRKDQSFRPKKHGRVFTKEQDLKKGKKKWETPHNRLIDPENFEL